jgi:hypothetical protein
MTLLVKASTNLTNRPKLGVAVVGSEELVAEARDSSGTQRRGTSAVGNRYQVTTSEENYVCCIYSDLWSVQLRETVVVTCIYAL